MIERWYFDALNQRYEVTLYNGIRYSIQAFLLREYIHKYHPTEFISDNSEKALVCYLEHYYDKNKIKSDDTITIGRDHGFALGANTLIASSGTAYTNSIYGSIFSKIEPIDKDKRRLLL